MHVGRNMRIRVRTSMINRFRGVVPILIGVIGVHIMISVRLSRLPCCEFVQMELFIVDLHERYPCDIRDQYVRTNAQHCLAIVFCIVGTRSLYY